MGNKNPIWNIRYEKLGVTPEELYMRQNGLCWLVAGKDNEGKTVINCTDGKSTARTDLMLNPTFECAKCISGFAAKMIEHNDNKSTL